MEEFFQGIFGILIFALVVFIFWVLPIWLGLKWAKIKGISKLWMLFGIHPFTGWIAFLVIKYGIDPRKECDKCKEAIKMEAQVCRYCGNEMSEEDIKKSILEFENRKR